MDDLKERIDQLERMIAAHKYAHTVELAGDEPSPQKLESIMKLEARLENMKSLQRLRELSAGA